MIYSQQRIAGTPVWGAQGGTSPGTPMTYSVTVRLVNAAGIALPNITALYWVLLSAFPSTAVILQQGNNAVSDSNGDVILDVTASGLTTGASAWLVLTDGAAAPSTKGRVIPVMVI